MMSMQRSRKGCRIEKIENSTALQPSKRTCQKRDNKSDHACAISPWQRGGACTLFCRTPKGESANCRQDKQTRGHGGVTGHPHRACAAVGAGRLVPLPDMSHFAAEFYQCCADLPARF